MTDSEWVTPSLYHALSTYFAYLQPLKSYSTFSFWLGFPYCRPNLWGFRGKWPTKSQNLEKHLLRGHFLRQTTSFELLCVKIGSRVWAVRVARKKNDNNNNKRHGTPTFHHHVGAPPLIRSNQIWLGCWSAWRHHPCQIWKQTIIIVTLVSGWILPF